MFGKKTSALRDFTNAIGITKEEPSAWQAFKASAGQFWQEDKASARSFFETDHARRVELAQARNTFTVGLAWPARTPAEKPSVVGEVVAWALAHPAEAATAVAVGAAAGKWVADRVFPGAPKAEPEPKA